MLRARARLNPSVSRHSSLSRRSIEAGLQSLSVEILFRCGESAAYPRVQMVRVGVLSSMTANPSRNSHDQKTGRKRDFPVIILGQFRQMPKNALEDSWAKPRYPPSEFPCSLTPPPSIDGIVALIMAVERATTQPGEWHFKP